jgi:glycosyltransferase involved in cell wall biosynthesis
MATHQGETACNLEASLLSLENQILKPDQIVLVIDGPIDDAQTKLINQFIEKKNDIDFTIISLPKNGGLATALNHGLAACEGDYIMRMDSDDLSLPDRLLLEKSYLDAHPKIDLVATWSSEFYDGDEDLCLKISPTEHDAIVQALRWRNIIAHPSILVRKEALMRIGGYRTTVSLLEDYDLYVRLILKGARFHVIPKVLLRVRTNREQRARRGNLQYFLNECRFRYGCFKSGFLNGRQLVISTALYGIFRLIGTPVRGRLYAMVRS